MDTSVPGSGSGKNSQNVICVTGSEAGQKLIQLLERRLSLPTGLLHRWIRTGQIRCDGARAKPFDRIPEGCLVRLPPFALSMAAQVKDPRQEIMLPLPPRIGEHNGLLALRKPSGLPTHSGTGHEDSLASRLHAAYRDEPFIPTPVHRLDKDTSGILLVALTHAVLRTTHEQIRRHAFRKEYVCWVRGAWPVGEMRCLRDMLQKQKQDEQEKVGVVGSADSGKEAVSQVTPLIIRRDSSLLLIRIVTGRTHQIRVQMAHAGHPVLGDRKYAAGHDPSGTEPALLLHACRITLPDGHVFTDLPSWPDPYAVSSVPDIAYPDISV